MDSKIEIWFEGGPKLFLAQGLSLPPNVQNPKFWVASPWS